jgi:hypothetical protein
MSATATASIPSLQVLLQLYLESLNEKEIIAYNIAKSHLGSSFTLEKSNGFVEWRKANYNDQRDTR